MRKLTFILSVFFATNILAGEQLFKQANTEYSNENYSIAISLYDSVLTNELESAELYYNLGNCYYQTQDWANAIWHYEKSLQLNSQEKTLQNLALAKLKIVDRIEPLPQLFYKKWWHSTTHLFSTKSWQILTLIAIGLIFILQLLNQFTSIKNKLLLSFLYPFTIISLLIAYSSYNQNFVKKEGIIFTSTVTVNSAPTSNSTDLFSLHSGSKVQVIDEIGDWINVEIVNGNSGWIMKNTIKEL